MICPKCKMEYREGYNKCSDCGEDLIDIDSDAQKQNYNKEWICKFGETTAQRAISLLFFLCILPLLYASILLGKYLYLTNTYSKDISFKQYGHTVYTSELVNNLPLGILSGIVFFILAVLVWKIVCELLIIIFRAIETYTQKNKFQ